VSILNIVWSPSRVTIAVDTNCEQTEGAPECPEGSPRGPVCKLMPLPSFGAVVAGRGSAALVPHVALAAQLSTMGKGLDFDGLLQGLPALVQGVHASMCEDLRLNGLDPALIAKYEFAVAGWSAQRNCMAAISYWYYDEGEGFQTFELGPTWPAVLAPRFDFEWEHTPPRTPAAMFSLAQLQVAEARTRGPRGTGGRLLIAELTKSSVSVTDHGELARHDLALRPLHTVRGSDPV
jgi:hypothetical protein